MDQTFHFLIQSYRTPNAKTINYDQLRDNFKKFRIEYIVPKTVDKHTAPVITKTPLYYGDDWIYNMLP